MKSRLSVLLALLCGAVQAHASCGAAYCLLNTNWATQGVWVEPGARLDLRYEYIDQNQVRSGSGPASEADLASQDHIERETINRNLLASFDYAFDDRFGVAVTAPLLDRDHTHIHVAENVEEQWRFRKLGDLRIVGRMQLSPAVDLTRAYGITFGVKLPTGDFTVANGDGERAERSLQPGTGTTDAIVGGYFRQALPAIRSSWFAQFDVQSALNSRADFKPGRMLTTGIGYSFQLAERAHCMLQLNYAVKQRDEGAEAEPDDSGSRTLTLSPGLGFTLTPRVQLYGFVQARVYQYVNGVQLSAQRGFVGGISARF